MKYKKILITGNFNVIHSGHLRILGFAKKICKKLVVGIFSDKNAGHSAFVSEKERVKNIKSNIFVDEVFIIRGSLEKSIIKIKPDAIVKGIEFKNKFNFEEKILKKINSKLIFSSGNSSLSSLNLISSEYQNQKSSKLIKPDDYIKRHKITKKNILKTISKFKKLKVLVIGDSILDEYIDTEPVGMSQEDATIVVSPIDKKKFVGGASIVAAHAASLGSKSYFLSVVGNDNEGKFLEKKLKDYGVFTNFITDDSRPTTKKVRFRSSEKSLLRLNTFDQTPISSNIENKILNKIEKLVKKVDVVIFSDFNYGLLNKKFVNKIADKINNSKKITIAADSQSSSQLGDITKFKKIDLITPTEYEARVSSKNFSSGIVELSLNLLNETNVKNVVLTLNKEGILIQSGKKENYSTDKLNALSEIVRDPAGAGDSFLIISAMSFAINHNIWISAYLGSLASALQVQKIGNTPLDPKELTLSI